MNENSIFATRFYELKKEKGMSMQKIADFAHISVNGLNNYFKEINKDSSYLPPMQSLKLIAECFDVDVAYLIGEIDCKRIAAQKLKDLTGLSDESARNLEELCKKITFKSLIDEILCFGNLKELLQNIIDYGWCDARSILCFDRVSKNEFLKPYNIKEKKAIFRYEATNNFNKLLDYIFECENLNVKNARIKTKIQDIFFHAAFYIDSKDERNVEVPLNCIEDDFEEIRELDSSCYILQYTPQYIIENWHPLFEEFTGTSTSIKDILGKKNM